MEHRKLQKYIEQFNNVSRFVLMMDSQEEEDNLIKASSYVLSNIVFVTERVEVFRELAIEVFNILGEAVKSPSFEHDNLRVWVEEKILHQNKREVLIKELQDKNGYQKLIPFIAISGEFIGIKAHAILLKHFYKEYEREALRILDSLTNGAFLPKYKVYAHYDSCPTIYPMNAADLLQKEEMKSITLNNIIASVNDILSGFKTKLKPAFYSWEAYEEDIKEIFKTSNRLLLYKWTNKISIPQTLSLISQNKEDATSSNNFLLNEILNEIKSRVEYKFTILRQINMPTSNIVEDHLVPDLDLLHTYKKMLDNDNIKIEILYDIEKWKQLTS